MLKYNREVSAFKKGAAWIAVLCIVSSFDFANTPNASRNTPISDNPIIEDSLKDFMGRVNKGKKIDAKSPTKESNGIVFEVSAKNHGIVVNKIENATSGYNWVAPNSGIGPSYVIGNREANFAVANPGDLRLVSAKILPGEQNADSATALWVCKDGLELCWMMTRSAVSNVIEFQSELKNTSAGPIPNIISLGSLDLRLNVRPEDIVVHHVNRQNYRKQTVSVPAVVKGGEWNNPSSAGWVAIENTKANEILFIGVEWESYWTVRVLPDSGKEGILVQCYLNTQEHEMAPESSLVSPRVFLGLSHGDIDESLKVLHDHLRSIMPPLPNDFPWVAYDIWGTEATGVEEGIMAEIPFAAKIGVDIFYIDASWYEGSCKNGSGDWFTGVGNYGKQDRVKFPSGLSAISKKVHDAGMKFGLWFAPQVVDSSLIGTVIDPDFVARRNNKDISFRNQDWAAITQICTGNPKVVEHLKKVMSDAVEAYDLDWIKWDNSGLPGPICNRMDHGHGSTDGALAALNGQYEVWRYLRQRYPRLMIEECGYPSRLDYGLARTATSHWLADDTGNAEKVRQSQIHASYIFPAAHYSAWVLSAEGATDPDILNTVIRSRMIGQCGLGTMYGKLQERASLFPPEVIDALVRNIIVYKEYRHLLLEDVYHLLPPSKLADAWDAIQFCKRDGSEATVLIFRGKSNETEKILSLRGLKQDNVYEVKLVNSGEVLNMKGKELMECVKIELSSKNKSEILLLKVTNGHQ